MSICLCLRFRQACAKPLCCAALPDCAATPPAAQATPSAGNNVAQDFSPQVDIPAPPSPLNGSNFAATRSWRPTPPATLLTLQATLAVSVSLDLSVNALAIPGSPRAISIVAGVVNDTMSTLTGAGAAAGEPAELNPVRLVPRDRYGNLLAEGRLAVGDLSLEFTPAADDVRPFTVRRRSRGALCMSVVCLLLG